MQQRT